MWEQNTNSDSVAKRELRRLLLISKECGIGEESIGVPEGKIEELLDSNYYRDNYGIMATAISNYIYKAKANWTDRGVFLLIDGGSSKTRERMAEICLFRFLVYNSIRDGNPAFRVRMSEIISRFSTFSQSRFVFGKEMSNIPCLFIQEVDTIESPRTSNDCSFLLDSMLYYRKKHSLPTIISLSLISESFVTPGCFGKCFLEILQNKEMKEVFKVRMASVKDVNIKNVKVKDSSIKTASNEATSK